MLRPLRAPTACAHIGIFLRSLRSHSTHYARETIAKICSMGVIALRSPCSAQARGGLPWPPARRMRRALETAPISQTGSIDFQRIDVDRPAQARTRLHEREPALKKAL